MVDIDETIKDIDKTISQLREYRNDSKSNLNLTMGIVYGLIIGFLGSLSATIIYEEYVQQLSKPWDLLAM